MLLKLANYCLNPETLMKNICVASGSLFVLLIFLTGCAPRYTIESLHTQPPEGGFKRLFIVVNFGEDVSKVDSQKFSAILNSSLSSCSINSKIDIVTAITFPSEVTQAIVYFLPDAILNISPAEDYASIVDKYYLSLIEYPSQHLIWKAEFDGIVSKEEMSNAILDKLRSDNIIPVTCAIPKI